MKEPAAALPFHRERLLALGRLALLAPLPLPFSDSLEWGFFAGWALVVSIPLLMVSRGKVPRLPNWALNLVGLVLLFGFYFDLRMGVRSLLKATVHLLLATLLVKLVSIVKERDFATLLVLVTFVFVASVATSFHSTVVLFVGLFAAAAWPVLVRWALWRDLAGAPAEWGRDPRTRTLPGRRAIAGSVVACLVLAAPFFLVLPRIKSPYVRGQAVSQEIWTGFTESVDPGVSGRLKQSDEVVLRFETDVTGPGQRFAEEVRFRTLAFSTYEQRTWRKPSGPSRLLRPDRAGEIEVAAGPTPGATMLVDLAPLGSRYLPLPATARTVSLTGSATRLPGGGWLERDGLSNLLLPLEPQRGVTYEVGFGGRPEPDRLEPFGDDPSRRGTGSARVSAFVAEVAGGADPAVEPLVVAERLERFLAGRFAYSVDVPLSGASPVEEFLFERRKGHCEAFATAMAMALRDVGIPTRFVTGFLGAEPAFLGRTFVVRGRNAHAWVEVYGGPERGWLVFDPTPADGRPGSQRASLLAQLRNLGESVELLYDRWVLSFGQADQEELVGRLREAAERAALAVRRAGVDVATARGPRAAAAAAVALAVAWAAWRRLSPRGRRRGVFGTERGATPALAAYRSLQKLLRRRGAGLTVAAAPGETVAAAARCSPAAGRLSREIVRAYLLESFGGREASPDDARRLADALRELRRALREAPPAAG